MASPDLQSLWHEVPIVVIDTETTGVDEHDEIVEIAAVRFEAGREVAHFQSLIYPGCDIPAEATKVHGITDAMVMEAPRLADVAGELQRICDGAVPCAYNAPFDRGKLHKHLAGTDCPAFDPSWAWIDVYVIVSSPRVDKYVKGPGRLRLGAVCFRWQIGHESAHRALGDARATGELLWTLYEREKIKSCTLGKLLDHTQRERAAHEADHARFIARMRRKDQQQQKGGARG